MYPYLGNEWRVEINFRYTYHYGTCCYLTRRIELNADFVKLSGIYYLEQLVLHEIAHALTPFHGHDQLFRDVCAEIGCVTPTSKFRFKKWKL
jgi:predicted SprT family Zn-dependent metalloprotease